MPCTNRQKTSVQIDSESPHMSEANVNSATDPAKYFFLPNCADNQLLIGTIITLAIA